MCTDLPGGGEPCTMPGRQCGEGLTCDGAGTCVTDPSLICLYTAFANG